MRPARAGDILAVLADLSASHRAEFATVGKMEAEVAFIFEDFARRGCAETFWHDDRPMAVIAIAPQFGVMTTWLAASQGFFDLGFKSVRYARNYMRGAVERFGPIVSATQSPHPQAEKWMRAIGYQEEKTPAGQKVFIWA